MPSMREVPLWVFSKQRKNPRSRAPRYKISLVKEPGSIYITSRPIESAAMIKDALYDLLEEIDREAFYVINLDQKHRIIGVNLVSMGTLTSSLVHMREVFKTSILQNAAAVIAVHNHPSGDPNPSRNDDIITKRLVYSATLLGLRVLDSIIIGEHTYFSYKDRPDGSNDIAMWEAQAKDALMGY